LLERDLFSWAFLFSWPGYVQEERAAPHRLPFALQKLLKAKTSDLPIAPRLGKELPTEGKSCRCSGD
jgi:hypothetical protein